MHVLVVANETVTGRKLIEAIEQHRGDPDFRVSVICPVAQPQRGYVVYQDTRRAAALAKKRGLKTKLGFTFRYSPAMQYMKTLIDDDLDVARFFRRRAFPRVDEPAAADLERLR